MLCRSTPARATAMLLGALLALLATPEVVALDAKLAVHPLRTMPGFSFSVLLPRWHGAVRGEMVDPDGRVVCSAEVFAPDLVPEANVVLLAVPSTAQTGAYRLRVRNRDGEVVSESMIEVVDREFKFEEIPLTQALTDIRSAPDPRRIREGERLMRELYTTRPEAIYQRTPLIWPLPEWIQTSWHGDRRVYLYADGARANAIHHGLDLAAPTGTPVAAAGNGRVVVSDDWIVSGGTVIIEHLPGVYSLYYHLHDRLVEEGSLVAAGTRIGTVGATGLATGPHLHWEIRVSGISVEPESLMRSWLLDNTVVFDTLSILVQ